MLALAVCFLWTVVAGALSEYILTEPQAHHPYQEEYAPDYDNYVPKDYHFEYSVSNPHTGDHKSQWEVKEKGVVKGMYSLLEPDGTTRVVEYVADDHGFRATVKKLGTPIEAGHHHGHDAIVPLPEAYNSGYSGAYSGLGENYGTASAVGPVTGLEHSHGTAGIEHYGTIIGIDNGHAIEGHAEPILTIGIDDGHAIEGYAAPIAETDGQDTSVEVHGFTGNLNDDSSYTNYPHEDEGANDANVYYKNEISEHPTYYYKAPSEIIPIPYHFEKPSGWRGARSYRVGF